MVHSDTVREGWWGQDAAVILNWVKRVNSDPPTKVMSVAALREEFRWEEARLSRALAEMNVNGLCRFTPPDEFFIMTEIGLREARETG